MAILLPDGDVWEHSLPTTLGPGGSRDSPHCGLHPWVSNQGWLRERCQVLPQCPRSHSALPSNLRGDHQGGSVQSLCTRALVSVSEPSQDVHLHPQGNASCPSQNPAVLCSTISCPQQLDQGPIIGKLSHGG